MIPGYRYDAVLFDAGNTLVHLDHALVAEIAGGGLTEATVWHADRAARTDPVLLSRMSGNHREAWHVYMEYILHAAGMSPKEAAEGALRLFELHMRRNLWRRVPPDVVPTLRRLKEAGLRLGVISNAEGTVEELLRDVGLLPLLEFVIDSHIVGIEKPNPRIFSLALQRTGTLPHRTLYVGDTYAIDIVGARAAGLDAALLDSFGVHHGVDCPRLLTLSDVLKLVALE